MDKKTERLNIRLTPIAKEIITDRANEYNMTITDFVTAIASVEKLYILGDENEFKNLVVQTKRIGGNVNQLRMLAQLGRISTVDLSDCTEQLAEINNSLRTIIKKANSWRQ